jgi:hypothetical protein
VTQAELHEASDHIHDNLAVEDEHLVPSAGFDYQAVSRALGEEQEPDEQVDFTDAASAVKSIILWCCAPPTLTLVGARCAALLAWLDPIQAATHNRDSLTKIAAQADVTKAAVSKWLIELRDALGLQVGIGKSQMARAKYRDAQYKAFAAGKHSSFTRRDYRKQSSAG